MRDTCAPSLVTIRRGLRVRCVRYIRRVSRVGDLRSPALEETRRSGTIAEIVRSNFNYPIKEASDERAVDRYEKEREGTKYFILNKATLHNYAKYYIIIIRNDYTRRGRREVN